MNPARPRPATPSPTKRRSPSERRQRAAVVLVIACAARASVAAKRLESTVASSPIDAQRAAVDVDVPSGGAERGRDPEPPASRAAVALAPSSVIRVTTADSIDANLPGRADDRVATVTPRRRGTITPDRIASTVRRSPIAIAPAKVASDRRPRAGAGRRARSGAAAGRGAWSRPSRCRPRLRRSRTARPGSSPPAGEGRTSISSLRAAPSSRFVWTAARSRWPWSKSGFSSGANRRGATLSPVSSARSTPRAARPLRERTRIERSRGMRGREAATAARSESPWPPARSTISTSEPSVDDRRPARAVEVLLLHAIARARAPPTPTPSRVPSSTPTPNRRRCDGTRAHCFRSLAMVSMTSFWAVQRRLRRRGLLDDRVHRRRDGRPDHRHLGRVRHRDGDLDLLAEDLEDRVGPTFGSS